MPGGASFGMVVLGGDWVFFGEQNRQESKLFSHKVVSMVFSDFHSYAAYYFYYQIFQTDSGNRSGGDRGICPHACFFICGDEYPLPGFGDNVCLELQILGRG